MKFLYFKLAGYWFGHLKAANNKIIAQGEPYKNKRDCLSAVKQIKGNNDIPVERVEK